MAQYFMHPIGSLSLTETVVERNIDGYRLLINAWRHTLGRTLIPHLVLYFIHIKDNLFANHGKLFPTKKISWDFKTYFISSSVWHEHQENYLKSGQLLLLLYTFPGSLVLDDIECNEKVQKVLNLLHLQSRIIWQEGWKAKCYSYRTTSAKNLVQNFPPATSWACCPCPSPAIRDIREHCGESHSGK